MVRNRIFSLFLLLFLTIPTMSGIRILNTLGELGDTEFGKTFPRHGLKLLYWLTDNLEIDQNNVINLGDIDPSRCDYGFNKIRNVENIFPSDANVSYYTVGNLSSDSSRGQFPDYVTADFYNSRTYPDSRNLDRIVVQSHMKTPSRVKKVYITQQYLNSSSHDEDNTYEISLELLRKIKNITNELSTPDKFLQQAGYDVNGRNDYIETKFHCIWDSDSRKNPSQCDTCGGMKLEVSSSDEGNARITWSGIPKTILNNDLTLKLYGNMNGSKALYSSRVGHKQTGSHDTSVRLDGGLQVRLMEAEWSDKEIWVSQEFDEANKQLPTPVSGYNASMELFVQRGKACVRLYIHELFTDWKDEFYNSWVGFYSNQFDGHRSYRDYQWVIYFDKNHTRSRNRMLVYEYRSNFALQPGVQLRFFLRKDYSCALAYSMPWRVTATETNDDYKTDLSRYNSALQLIVKKCKVGVRLYIDKSFTGWRDELYYSWVGFYRSSNDHNKKYQTWQGVTKFQRSKAEDVDSFMAYDYESDMDIGPGVNVRFFLTSDYSSMDGETRPWKGVVLPHCC